ncbi:MAG: ATP-binding protein, partial [Actinomycetota bacterium]
MAEQERPGGEEGRPDPAATAADPPARRPVRVEVLGRVRLEPTEADRCLGGGQARELLALLVARRGRPTTTTRVIDALWPQEPPATAATIVHGLVRRIRRCLGTDAVVHDDRGYRLDLAPADVDLWTLDEHLRAGDRTLVQRSWREPAFGVYRDRPWARDAIADFASIVEVDGDLTAPRSRRRVPVSRLVGRRRELSTVTAAVRRSRLVTIVGLGGVGKTRLALEVLRELRPDHDAHIDIGAAAGPAAARLATELGLAPSGDPERDLRAVCSVIGRRSMVLLLDGCEHDLPGAAQAVETLLGTCIDLRIVATSRLTLGVPGEHVVPLLPFADPGDPRGDAVELLLDRAQGIGLSVPAADRVLAAEICERCAGVPLAIELGVSELVLGGLDADAGAVRQRDGRPGPISPEGAVDEVIDHALAQLSEHTRRTAVRLSPLVAGFTPELVGAVGPDGASATGILHELVANGLVVADTTGPTRRLRFLDRVRATLQQQVAPGDADVLLAALLDVFGAVRPDLEAPLVLPALGRAVAELPNGQALLDDLAARARPVDRLLLATVMAARQRGRRPAPARRAPTGRPRPTCRPSPWPGAGGPPAEPERPGRRAGPG